MTRFDKIGLQSSGLGAWHGFTPDRGGFRLPHLAARAGQRAAVLGGLGLVSAVLSDRFGGWDGSLPYPILPGVYFGLVLVAGVWLWGTRRPLALLGVFAATNLAWWGAFEASLRLYSHVQDWSPVPAAWCGLLSGLIGSVLTLGAVAQACPDFNTRANWSRTLAVGGLAGILLQGIDIGGGSLVPLLLVWQGAVAASIGYGLTPARQSR